MVDTSRVIELLPDPTPRDVVYTLISVDDHLVEPPDVFEGRLPARLQDRAPRVDTLDNGDEVWVYEGVRIEQRGTNAVAGQANRESLTGPMKFADMRPGCFRIADRVRDMDLNGVWASVNFPSMVTGFCGRVFSASKDQELGLAVARAWNDWMYEEWYSPYPERVVPMGLTWLSDPVIGAAEIVRNAERGFTAVTLPEQPHRLGYPSLHSGYWDPILRACEETDTVICLHVGSSGVNPTADDAPGVLDTRPVPGRVPRGGG